jgi:hypothetical protein
MRSILSKTQARRLAGLAVADSETERNLTIFLDNSGRMQENSVIASVTGKVSLLEVRMTIPACFREVEK